MNSDADKGFLPGLLDLHLLHACAEKGVKLKLFFEYTPDVALLERVLNEFFIHRTGNGFFRGQLGRWVTVTGIPGQNHFTMQFSMLFRDRAIEDLELHIPGFQEEYNLGLMYLEERRKGEAL